MKQCKICGIPLGNEPSTLQLEEHWKKHHNWHWEKNQDKTPEDALLKKRQNKKAPLFQTNGKIHMEFIITIFHYHKGHDIDKAIFGKKANENKINEDIRIFPSGGLTKKNGIQEKYLKVNLKNNNDFNLELLSDFLSHRLSIIDDADSLKIGNNIIAFKKDEIKKALQIHLDENQYQYNHGVYRLSYKKLKVSVHYKIDELNQILGIVLKENA